MRNTRFANTRDEAEFRFDGLLLSCIPISLRQATANVPISWTLRPRVREDYGPFTSPELEGLSVDGRLAVIYSKFDPGNGWEQFPHPSSYGLNDDSTLQIGTNVLVYAATH